MAGGGQYQGLCLEAPYPSAEGQTVWGEAVFKDLPCPAGGFVLGSILLAGPIPSNLGQHFIPISCRGVGSCVLGPLGHCWEAFLGWAGDELTALPAGTWEHTTDRNWCL